MTIGRHRPAGTMLQQSPLGEGTDALVRTHRLFFALFPDEAARHAIAEVAEELQSKHIVRGRRIDPSRYHMTLNFLGHDAELRQDMVDCAKAAAMKVKLPAFVLSLDHIASFHGRKPPCVLRCADEATPVHALWQALRRELMHAGLAVALEQDFTPHVTLFYSDGALLEHRAIGPIAWTVREFVLVHSVVGRKDYRILARWMLHD
jgi:2'-5' RNA ligase